MFPEKPKNKAKRDANSRPKLTLLVMVLVLALGGMVGFLLLRQSIPLQLNDVIAVRIQDSWAGLSPASPQNSRYTLTIVDGALHGSAEYSVGYEPDIIAEESVMIPPEVVTAFLDKLEEAQLTHGSYTPLIEWTDDYPRISIQIDTTRGMVEIYSQSQGTEHIPWGATFDGNDYTINSGIPAQALAILEPYLHRDVLRGLIDEAMSPPEPSSP